MIEIRSISPDLFLLDEPTSSLDPRSTKWLVGYLQHIDATTLVTTHKTSVVVALVERTIVLSERHGLVYDGPLAKLLRDQEKLIEANLAHVHKHKHKHKHKALEHDHFHTRAWE